MKPFHACRASENKAHKELPVFSYSIVKGRIPLPRPVGEDSDEDESDGEESDHDAGPRKKPKYDNRLEEEADGNRCEMPNSVRAAEDASNTVRARDDMRNAVRGADDMEFDNDNISISNHDNHTKGSEKESDDDMSLSKGTQQDRPEEEETGGERGGMLNCLQGEPDALLEDVSQSAAPQGVAMSVTMQDVAQSAIPGPSHRGNQSQPEYLGDENADLQKNAEAFEALFLSWFPLL